MQFLTKKACAPGSFIASPSSLNVCHQIIGRLYERAHSHTLFDIANSFSSLFLFFSRILARGTAAAAAVILQKTNI